MYIAWLFLIAFFFDSWYLQNYIAVSGEGIDSLWQLEGAFDYAPQWSAIAPKSYDGFDDSDSDIPNGRSAIVKKKKKPLAITSGGTDSDDSMPGLQSVSNTSDDDEDDDDDEEEEEEEDSSGDESGYNTEEEDEIRELWREAMDVAHEADYFDASAVQPEIDPFSQEDRKGNPFLKMLGSLRGRLSKIFLITILADSRFFVVQVECSRQVLSSKLQQRQNLGSLQLVGPSGLLRLEFPRRFPKQCLLNQLLHLRNPRRLRRVCRNSARVISETFYCN